MNFADTGAFLALYHRRDQHYKEALRLWPTLERPVFTSNHVIAELAKLLARRAGYRLAVDCIADIYASSNFQVLASTRADEIAAIQWMRKYADQRISFADCISLRSCAAIGFALHSRSTGISGWPVLKSSV